MRVLNREIYYYNTASGVQTEKCAGRFLGLISEEMKRKKKTELLFLCIGTDIQQMCD